MLTLMIPNLCVLFWLRKNKLNKAGYAPIYCRVTLNGQRANDFTTNLKSGVSDWNSTKQQTADPASNLLLLKIATDIKHKYIQLAAKREYFSATDLVQLYNCKANLNHTILDICTRYLQLIETQAQCGVIKNVTYKRYVNLLKNVTAFCNENRLDTLHAEQFSLDKANMFSAWLVNRNKCCPNHANRFLSYINNAFKHAQGLGLINANPLTGMKLKKSPAKKPIYIKPSEIGLIAAHKFASERLQAVADMFLWQCHTGQSFADFAVFDKNEFCSDADGHHWLTYERAKNNEPAIVIMCEFGRKLLAKYPKGFSSITNQKYNSYLKEVAEIVGIKVNLTSHVGRKTFANVLINEHGFSPTVVAKMMGHKKFETTWEHYSRATVERIKLEMRQRVA